MLNFIYLFLSFWLVFLNPVYSGQSGVADDFKAMLTHSENFSPNESFATHVTRPFVQNPMQDKRFFSDPKASRSNWNQQHKDWSKTQNTVSPLKIFETMGISRQGLLNNDPSKYRNLSNAQTQGMLRIIKGDLGFADRSCTKDEGDIIALELLNIGRSIGASAVLMSDIEILEKAYRVETNIAKKQHLQISALLMLQGAQSKIEMTEWYLDGLQDRKVVLEKIHRYYTDAFLSNTPVPIAENTYEELVLKAKDKKWENVTALLSQLTVGSGDNRQNSVIEAIRLLNNYNKNHKNQSGDEMPPEIIHAGMLLNDECRHIRRKTAVFPQQKLDHYIAHSRILQMYVGTEKEELSNSLRKTLSTWVHQNGNKWPEKNLKVAEQVFWNLYPHDNANLETNLINLLFSIQFLEHPRDWEDFKDFTNPYLAVVNPDRKPLCMSALFPIYQAFANEEDRKPFIDFCNPYLAGVNTSDKPSRMSALLPIYQAFANEEDRKPFIDFCNPYLAGVHPHDKPPCMLALLPIYQAFANQEERQPFLVFCDPYVAGVDAYYKSPCMKVLISIYQAFANEGDRNRFIAFCDHYLAALDATSKPFRMKDLLSIYQAFFTQEERQQFTDFCDPYLVGVEEYSKPSCMKELLPIYQVFVNDEVRDTFIAFCDPYLAGGNINYKLSCMKVLISIYQALANEGDRNRFIAFCDHYLAGLDATSKPFRMKDLLSIYLSNQKEDFELFIRLHSVQQMSQDRVSLLISSYLIRAYLKEMRVEGALKAERNPDNRRQPMHETNLENPLPVLYPQDLFLQQARNATVIFANAHDFDPVYELERPLLWGQTDRYNNRVSSTSRTIHNGEASTVHQTNEEVEDFIRYLDSVIVASRPIKIDTVHLEGTKVVSIIKQMLGLEPKSGTTRGGFAPYLSSSMYYAKPESPLGDEMLGRTWFYIKNLPGSSQDIDDYKKSVVLALLEAAEISVAGIDTHCQTRITGELMKLVSQTLPGSHLRPLIMGIDLPLVQSEAAIKARITAAPLRAQQLFKNMKREDSGNLRKLIEHQNKIDGSQPELWQRYEAYYDDFYRRTKAEDGNGYRLDEHILLRDDQGNLVSKYNVDGSLRATPVIVYYQSEFQVLEKVFTELMRKEFEEQRGLKY